MKYRFIEFIIDDGIAQIKINRPEVLNALNIETGDEIIDVCNKLKKESSARAMIITGSGSNFAAGADIIPMMNASPQEARKLTFNRAFNSIESLELPVIAAISGYALGGGLELALACDFRICSEDAKMGLPEIKLGIFPGAGGTQRLPKIIGTGRAKEMIFTGAVIEAERAFEIGLVNSIAEDDVLNEALKMAKTFRSLSPLTLGAAKRAVNFGLGNDLQAGIRFEEELWAGCFSTDDQREGMKAFSEKRKPEFTGR
ncbi:MAG TPA: enoyl-CoA hydratase-related protein [Spirochaetota bacterium]|nr:enoyl-CoA hydratase-related protein [Spirochaetota bacterium]HPI91440.1 enoyl-CoA hydratase-related protein [Spirochaetota bacterium]HRX48254.1 enoyl-CoA hydratase-related protein [Spirochaetota bacterium]